jgi:hypothetical protein
MADHTDAEETAGYGTRIETLILANHAEAVNGLLYISGGCWTRHHRAVPPADQPAPLSTFGIALGVLVPWTEANRPHVVTLTIEPEDDPDHPLIDVNGQLIVGRPPDAKPGSDQRTVLAVNANLQFPKAAGYCLKAALSSGDVRTVSFDVVDVAVPLGT